MAEVTTITENAPVVTLINVFTVQPDRQRQLVDVLTRATDDVMRHLPGFVAANFHASTDGTRVVNYAQWESEEAFHAMLGDATAREHMDEASALADAVDPHLYTVASVHHV